MLTPEDHVRITAAVAAAEQGSSGDIFCVLAGEVSSYREVPIAWGAVAALLIPPAVLALSLRPLIEIVNGGWETGSAHHEIGLALTIYVTAQICLFGLVA